MAREGDLGVLSFRTMEERELKPQPSLGEEGAVYTPSQNVAVAASLGAETPVCKTPESLVCKTLRPESPDDDTGNSAPETPVYPRVSGHPTRR